MLWEMWRTRPTRPRQNRHIAGVAAGIARRYGIDPVLVRVGFVVTAFYGVGAVLYIAGWLALPEDPADGPRAHPHPLLLLGLGVATLVSLGAAFAGIKFFLIAALAVVLLVLLHASRGEINSSTETTTTTSTAEATSPTTITTGTATGEAPTTPVDSTTESPEPQAQATPPSWDPLGVAPFAWDLPEPSPAPPSPEERPRRPRTTSVTLAAALLAAGVTSLVMLIAGQGMVLSVMLGAVLAVLGMGLLVGAFTRSGRGLIPIALALSVVTYVVVATPQMDDWRGGVGSRHYLPATAADVAPTYRHAMGEFLLDMRQLDLSVPPGTPPDAVPPVRTSIQLGMGQAQIFVPRDADVTVRVEVGLGRVAFEGKEGAGVGSTLTVVDDLGSDDVRSGRAIELELDAGVGNVEVFRG